MIIFIFAFLTSLSSHAELFRSAYVSFELPQNWKCDLEGTEWICTSKFAKETKEAIIVLTAKEVGPQDSLMAYEDELKNPRRLNNMTDGPLSKVVQAPKRRQIANHLWIDAIHLSSEVPNYYTRYVATIKDRLAITVTFSAFKTQYTKYSADFIKAIDSMRAVAAKDILGSKPILSAPGGGESMGTNVGGPIGPGIGAPGVLPSEPKSKDNTITYVAIALIVLAAGMLLWRKK
jgi:hypothetical protein